MSNRQLNIVHILLLIFITILSSGCYCQIPLGFFMPNASLVGKLVSLPGSIYSPSKLSSRLAAAAKQLGNESHLLECLFGMFAIAEGVVDGEGWALKWVDAGGKPPSGLIGGALQWVGSFEECQRAQISNTNVSGKYCSVLFNIGAPTSQSTSTGLRIGFCIPEVCNLPQLLDVIDFVTALTPVHPNPTFSQCHSKEPLVKDSWFWAAIFILVVLTCLALTGTSIDALLYFHWYFAAQESKSDGLMETGSASDDHSSQEQQSITMSNVENNGAFLTYRSAKLERSRVHALLTCFSIPYNSWRLCHIPSTGDGGCQNRNPLEFLHGYRTMSMAWVVIGHSIAELIPLTNNVAYGIEMLKNSWFSQGVINGTLSVDTFFFLSGLLTCYLTITRYEKGEKNWLYRVKFWTIYALRRLWRLTPVYIVVMVVYSGLYIHLYNGPLYPTRDEMTDIGFCKSHGYLTYLNNLIKADEMKFTKTKRSLIVLTGLSIATIICILPVYGLAGWYRMADNPLIINGAPLSLTASYQALYRISFVTGIAIVALLCANDFIGPIRAILTWQPFKILARITYCTYMIHVPIIAFIYQSSLTPLMLSFNYIITCAILMLTISHLGAYILHIFVEAPFVGLEKRLIKI